MNIDELRERQALPVDEKIKFSIERLKKFNKWCDGNCYVSFSGGKDSIVLLDICRSVFPEMRAMFINTGLEYPSLVDIVKKTKNVTTIRPEVPFHRVIEQYGYPIISKMQAQYIEEARSGSEKLKDIRINGRDYGYGDGKSGPVLLCFGEYFARKADERTRIPQSHASDQDGVKRDFTKRSEPT